MSESGLATIFVSSSSGSVGYAEAVQRNLQDDRHRVTVWRQGAIRPATYILDELCEISRTHDFGVFFFAPDDITTIRNKEQSTVRDNVLFELGLFMGIKGIGRAFMIAPKIEDFRIPSDLSGFVNTKYDPNDEDQDRAVGSACGLIKKRIDGHIRKELARDEPSRNAGRFAKDLDAVSKGRAPEWGVLAKVVATLARQWRTRDTLSIADIVHLSALPGDADDVLSFCRALSSRGLLIRGPHPDEKWSPQTSVNLLTGDDGNPRCVEYWANSRSQRLA